MSTDFCAAVQRVDCRRGNLLQRAIVVKITCVGFADLQSENETLYLESKNQNIDVCGKLAAALQNHRGQGPLAQNVLVTLNLDDCAKILFVGSQTAKCPNNHHDKLMSSCSLEKVTLATSSTILVKSKSNVLD